MKQIIIKGRVFTTVKTDRQVNNIVDVLLNGEDERGRPFCKKKDIEIKEI